MIMMRTTCVEDMQGRSVDELLREVVATQETLRVKMPDGEYVEIKPLPKLKPLTRLEGSLAPGWKDAIYEPKR